jgi:hypothetical protein
MGEGFTNTNVLTVDQMVAYKSSDGKRGDRWHDVKCIKLSRVYFLNGNFLVAKG